ncbi:RHS repeat-associated core domain-containing protein [Xenorhabdus szentirmaii]|uniref:RHS repeat-associated core domain-containing protein n=1 Tax=Xenorhabdus szentirmaii TaxID=290112 RepID=UPI0019880913|nr:RHS repeat-associated core domain-containing protein [Xenorhabdus sp. 38]MBD2782846.1 hypothetical protein [Xenorhabdus sp. 38]
MSFGLTSYDASTTPGRLQLASGEQYRVNHNAAGTHLTLRQCRRPPTLTIEMQISEEGSRCVVRHNTGMVEILKKYAQEMWLPVQIMSPIGRSLHLEWNDRHRQGTYLLTRITGEAGNVLCKFDYDSYLSITIWPDTLETLTFNLLKTNGYLRKIKNVSQPATPLTWSLDYDPHTIFPGDVNPLSYLVTPAGLTQKVDYAARQMLYNTRHGQGGLPAVTRSLLSPGLKQPLLQIAYRYDGNNYLGHGAQFQDFNENDDNLFSVPGSHYTYWTEERVHHPDGGEQVTRRTYNKFHLLTEERFTQGDCTHTKTTHYYADENKPFSQQLSTYQFPKQNLSHWQKGNTASPMLSTSMEYDEQGHQTCQTTADGTIVKMQWYPAIGEPGRCPADPGGFSCFIKSRTVYPPQTFKDEPITRVEYTYIDIAEKAKHRRQAVIMPLTETHFLYSRESEAHLVRQNVTYAYYCDDVSASNFGRLERKTTTFRNDNSPAHPYVQHTDYAFVFNSHRLTRTVTLSTQANAADSDYGGMTRITSDTVSTLSGLVQTQTDSAGSTLQNYFNALGQQTGMVLHPDEAEYRQETRIDWQPTSASSPAQVTKTDPLGNRIRISHDALEQVLASEIQDSDGPASARDVWHTMLQHTLDSWGRVTESMQTDYLRAPETDIVTPALLRERIELRTTLTYDYWGQVSTITGSDGIVHHSLADPIACTVTRWTTDRTGKDTAYIVTHHHKYTHQVVKMEVFESADALIHNTPYSISHQEWDGVGRLRTVTDALGRVTRYEYDVFGRPLRTVLADKTQITRRYARFSSAPLPVAVAVMAPDDTTETVLGEQRFDALGRPVSMTVGGRTTTYTHELNPKARPNKNSIIEPDGSTQDYLNEPRLGGALTAVTATQPGGKKVHKTYRYTPKTGHLLDMTEGNSVVTALYSPSGHAAGEITSVHSSKALSTHRLYSLAGRLQQERRGDGSCWTYSYATSGNQVGLLTQMTDDKTVKVVFFYDGLNRVAQTVATALQSRHVLKTDIERDAFGREVKRIFNSNAQDTRTLLQEYDVVGRVVRRTLHKGDHQGEVLTDEQFTYDLRSRLSDYRVSGSLLPKDAYGNAIVRQTFMADALDNITKCVTTLQTGESNTATHHYKNAKDPCQLSYVTNTLTSRGYPSKIPLLYDGAGRLVRDEVGRILRYDALGRLNRVESAKHGSGDYGYDAFDRLAWQQGDDTRLLHRLYYDDNTLTNEWISASEQNQQADTIIRYLGTVAQTTLESHGEETLLLGTDQKQSVMAVCRETLTDQTYTPYGLSRPSDNAKSRAVKGYNGERCDPITGTTHLGNGYRAYNPVLMRFHCPDSWSPFGKGGLNSYAYCGGDPINHADPSGHVNWWSVGFGIFGIVAAGIAAVLLAPVTGGASLALLVVVTTSAVVSGALDIASGALEDSHPELSRKLGTAALIVGIPAMVDGIARLPGMVRAGYNLVRQAPKLLRGANELYNAGVRNLLSANRLAITNTSTQITAWGPIKIGSITAFGVSGHDVAYVFTDLHKGRQRLNIVGHGWVDHHTGMSVISMTEIHGNTARSIDGAELAGMLERNGVNFRDYRSARMVVCYSADGEGASLAAQFALRSGLETKGFHGEVYTWTEWPQDYFPNLQGVAKTKFKSGGFGIIDEDFLREAEKELNAVLLDNVKFGHQPFKILKKGFEYRPHRYYPVGV